MELFRKDDLYVLQLFKQKKITRNNPMREVSFVTDLYKMLGMDKARVEMAKQKAIEHHFIEGNGMNVRPTEVGERNVST